MFLITACVIPEQLANADPPIEVTLDPIVRLDIALAFWKAYASIIPLLLISYTAGDCVELPAKAYEETAPPF